MFKEWKLETDVLPNIEYQKKKVQIIKEKKKLNSRVEQYLKQNKKKSLEGFNSRFELVEERVTK